MSHDKTNINLFISTCQTNSRKVIKYVKGFNNRLYLIIKFNIQWQIDGCFVTNHIMSPPWQFVNDCNNETGH